MASQITFNTKVGWISAFEDEGKIFKVKFARLKKQKKSKILKKFKKNLLQFFNKKVSHIKIPHKVKGNPIKKKYGLS